MPSVRKRVFAVVGLATHKPYHAICCAMFFHIAELIMLGWQNTNTAHRKYFPRIGYSFVKLYRCSYVVSYSSRNSVPSSSSTSTHSHRFSAAHLWTSRKFAITCVVRICFLPPIHIRKSLPVAKVFRLLFIYTSNNIGGWLVDGWWPRRVVQKRNLFAVCLWLQSIVKGWWKSDVLEVHGTHTHITQTHTWAYHIDHMWYVGQVVEIGLVTKSESESTRILGSRRNVHKIPTYNGPSFW